METWLPAAWSANTVTWVGSALMWLLLAGMIVVPSPHREQWAPLWVALLWGYCLLDHVDGCRARRRKSSSPWGEFLDHALDAWHGGITVFAIGSMGGNATHPGLLVLTMATLAVATVVTWLEQKLRGEFFLGAIGPVEAVAGAGIYFALWTWPAAAAVLRSPVSAQSGVTWADGVLLFGAGGNVITAAIVTRRSWGVAGPLAAMAVVAGGMVGLGFSSQLGWSTLGVAIAILTAEYTARVICSHLTRAAMPWPDVVGPVLLALAAVLPANSPAVAGAGVVWLAGRTLLTWRIAAQKLIVRAAASPVVLALETE